MKPLILSLPMFLSIEVAYSIDCINNDTYVNADNPLATCRWIRWKEERRQEYCKQQEVNDNCPLSCGVCCEDNPFIEFNCDSFNSDCEGAWFKGRTVRDICPKSCGFCKDFVAPITISGFMNDSTFTPEESLLLMISFVALLILLAFMIITGLLQIRGKRKVKKFMNESFRIKPQHPQPVENINSFGLPTTCKGKSVSSDSGNTLSSSDACILAPKETFDSIATIGSDDKYIESAENGGTSEDPIELLQSSLNNNREKSSVNWTKLADSIDRDEDGHSIASSIAEAKAIIHVFAEYLEDKLDTTDQDFSTILCEKDSEQKSKDSPQIERSHNSAPVKSLHFSSAEVDSMSILSGDFGDDNENSATSLYVSQRSFPYWKR